jgi:VWFA-related protein
MIYSARVSVVSALAAGSVLAALASLSAHAAPATRQTPNPRQQVAYVGVVNEAGESVAGLTVNDFSVREDGVSREVIRLEPVTEPVHVALVVDNSAAMEATISDVRTGLKGFVERLNPRDPIAVITTADRPMILLSYALDRPRVQKAIDQIFPVSGSGSVLLEAIIDTAEGLEKQGATRSAIVVVTGEGPEFSNVQYQTVVDAIKRSGAAFEVALVANTRGDRKTSENAESLRDADYNRSVSFDRGSAASGGRYRTLLSSLGVTGELKSLADELNNQYRLVYGRPESLIPPEKIEVKVKRPGMTARATPAKVRAGA